jgi:hypothetical protein
MRRLLADHFLPGPERRFSREISAAVFAWVPFFPVFGATVAAQPWALWAWLHLLGQRGRWYQVALLLAVPFYSSLVWAGPAFLLMLAAAWLYRAVANGERPLLPLLLLPAIALLYLVANWPMLNLFLGRIDLVSHRKEYDFFYDHQLSIGSSLAESLATFFSSHYHVGTFIAVPVLLAWVLARRGERSRTVALTNRLVLAIAGLSLFYGFYTYVAHALGQAIPLVTEFRFNRIIVLIPFLWCLVLALSLDRLSGTKPGQVALPAALLAAAQLAIALPANDEFLHNARQVLGMPRKPNYRSYVDKALFDRISAHIGRPKNSYRVASLGLNPTVAQLNGFYTLDGLQAIYDLRYKHRFRSIMAPELDKSEALRTYFDRWGNRCYLFSEELGTRDRHFMVSKHQPPQSVLSWGFDAPAFKALGGEYLFSTVQIQNAAAIGLVSEGVFESAHGWWRIWLYRAP